MSNTNRCVLAVCACVVACLASVRCDVIPELGLPDGVTTAESGMLRVYVTDKSSPLDVMEEVKITIARVEVLRSDGSPGCVEDSDCDDDRYCNGVEVCDTATTECQPGDSPCAVGEVCDEDNDTCASPCSGGDCDDGQFCNGLEHCDLDTGLCETDEEPCAWHEECDEVNDTCVPTFTGDDGDDSDDDAGDNDSDPEVDDDAGEDDSGSDGDAEVDDDAGEDDSDNDGDAEVDDDAGEDDNDSNGDAEVDDDQTGDSDGDGDGDGHADHGDDNHDDTEHADHDNDDNDGSGDSDRDKGSGRSDEPEWLVIFEGSRTLNLLDLQNGVMDLLADVVLPAGTYTQMKLIVTEGTVKVRDVEEPFVLRAPDGAEPGITVNISFDVGGDKDTVLLLDVDLSRMLGDEDGNSTGVDEQGLYAILDLDDGAYRLVFSPGEDDHRAELADVDNDGAETDELEHETSDSATP